MNFVAPHCTAYCHMCQSSPAFKPETARAFTRAGSSPPQSAPASVPLLHAALTPPVHLPNGRRSRRLASRARRARWSPSVPLPRAAFDTASSAPSPLGPFLDAERTPTPSLSLCPTRSTAPLHSPLLLFVHTRAQRSRRHCSVLRRGRFSGRFFPERPSPSDSSCKNLRREVLKPPSRHSSSPSRLQAAHLLPRRADGHPPVDSPPRPATSTTLTSVSTATTH